MVMVNTEDGLFTMHGTESEISTKKTPEMIAVVLVNSRAGMVLQQSIRTARVLSQTPMGSLVGLVQTGMLNERSTVVCGKCNSNHTHKFPSTDTSLVTGGHLQVVRTTGGRDHETTESALAVAGENYQQRVFEFLAADFGAPLILNQTLDMVAAQPIDGCHGVTNSESVHGKVVFMKRGQCSFVHKMQNALSAGAVAVVFGNLPEAPIANPGCVPEQLRAGSDDFNMGTLMPAVIVGHDASALLETLLPAKIRFVSDISVDVERYSSLTELYDIEKWAATTEERKKQVESALSEFHTVTWEHESLARKLLAKADNHYTATLP